jgi:MHS family alpha-ketoglutarate permease-like MFS transporter
MSPPTSGRARIGAIASGSAGNFIEWFDFYIYAFTALYFAETFFPHGDSTAQLLQVAGIYAVGFLVRPAGGWLFGRLADRHGRRAALMTAVLLMGAGSFLIAVLPGYEYIGHWAPALLLVARLMQGLSTGGEFGAAASYLSEVAADARRGLHASFLYVTIIAGQIAAILLLVIMQQVLDDAALRAWGWRVPFAIGALLALAILVMRSRLQETLVSHPGESEDAGSLKTLVRHRSALLVVLLLTAGGGVCLYTFTTYMQKFLVNTAGMSIGTASRVMLAALVVFMVLQPLMGALSDRIGRRACLLLFSGLMSVAAVPLLSALAATRTAGFAFLLVLTALVILSFYTSISGLFKAELFPQRVRALGVGLAHSVAIAVFGGTAEYVALWFKRAGDESHYFWYVAAICCVSFVTALCMREPRRASMAA